ncbi:MAG: alpha-galactosidase [Ruminococcaceae bacterium]|nr:alpha-galactosidase [Oscillospiraceae bacterium]
MEKFSLHIEYRANGTNYTTSDFETPDFKIDYTAFQNHIVLKLIPKTAVEITDLSVTVPYTFGTNDRIFLNGYQSWTDCREMFVDDIPQHTSGLSTPVFRHTMLGASGAYTFTENIKTPGEFSGFSYMYVRNEEKYDLFASLTERTGYTLFKTKTRSNEIIIKKDLDGIVISEEYEVLNIAQFSGDENDVFDKWFAAIGVKKSDAKPMNGYTTWYNYYPHINEKIVHDDLEALSKVDADIDIFQIDDGFQTATGDWLSVDSEKFPNGMKAAVEKIHAKDMLAGLWLAPFGAQFTSKLLKEHKDWFIKQPNGRLVKCGPNWGGFCALDIEIPEAREYIRHFFDVVLNEWGFDLVKLDFLYAAAIIPYHNKTRGQLMCEAMDFLRECVGDKKILGCGVPLMPAFGKVEYCRIGADMDLRWYKPTFCHREFVSTINTLGNSVFRRQLNGRAFLNDPDVFLLRENNMHMTFEQRCIIATVNKLFGSVLFTSDNVGDYRDEQMNKLLEVFRKDDIQILRAEFLPESRRVLDIDYVINGEFKNFRFDLQHGKIV